MTQASKPRLKKRGRVRVKVVYLLEHVWWTGTDEYWVVDIICVCKRGARHYMYVVPVYPYRLDGPSPDNK